jgi:hypothetical protein
MDYLLIHIKLGSLLLGTFIHLLFIYYSFIYLRGLRMMPKLTSKVLLNRNIPITFQIVCTTAPCQAILSVFYHW